MHSLFARTKKPQKCRLQDRVEHSNRREEGDHDDGNHRKAHEPRESDLPRDHRDRLCSHSIINFTFNDHFPFSNGPEGAFVHLGLPQYFKIELTTAKILGVLALLIPNVPFKIKEFAYFGFGITLISASIAHFARGDARLSVLFIIDPLFFSVC